MLLKANSKISKHYRFHEEPQCHSMVLGGRDGKQG